MFIRALLGLSDKHEYLLDDGNRNPSKEKLVVSINHRPSDNDTIERFSSPLTFKVFDNKTYILVNPIHENIFGKSFKFSALYKKKDTQPIHIKDLGELNVPKESDFNLIAFLNKSLPSLGFKPL